MISFEICPTPNFGAEKQFIPHILVLRHSLFLPLSLGRGRMPVYNFFTCIFMSLKFNGEFIKLSKQYLYKFINKLYSTFIKLPILLII